VIATYVVLQRADGLQFWDPIELMPHYVEALAVKYLEDTGSSRVWLAGEHVRVKPSETER